MVLEHEMVPSSSWQTVMDVWSIISLWILFHMLFTFNFQRMWIALGGWTSEKWICLSNGLCRAENRTSRWWGEHVHERLHNRLETQKWNSRGVLFFSTVPHYHVGSLVYLQVPLAGNEACIYNPATGKEDLKLLLEMSDLELNRMRGFWSAWELIGNGLRAKYRADITPKPAGFKPLKPRSKKKKLRLNVDQLSATSQNSSVHTGRLHFGNSRSPVLVCGVSSQGANTQKGMVVARSNKTRPNLVNLEGYQYGMTQFVKVPEEGRIIQLYNSVAKQWVDCTLLMSDEYDIEKIRNQWVIVKLKKHTRYKRALKIIALPREFYKKKTNWRWTEWIIWTQFTDLQGIRLYHHGFDSFKDCTSICVHVLRRTERKQIDVWEISQTENLGRWWTRNCPYTIGSVGDFSNTFQKIKQIIDTTKVCTIPAKWCKTSSF